MTDTVTFTSMQMIVNSDSPSDSFLKRIFSPRSINFNYEKTWHALNFDIVDKRYYWLYSNFGRAMPHRDIVFDIISKKELKNPRTTVQVEPTKQFFAVYDSKVEILYVSTSSKKQFIADLCRESFPDYEIIIKNIYKTIDEFIEEIKSIESIKFTGFRNLFNQGGDLMEPLANIFGYNEPEEFSIEAKYNSSKREFFKKRLRMLSGKQKEGELKNLVCVGKNDKGFETIFNSNSFMNRIFVLANKDEQELYEPNEIKPQIISELERLSNV